jgi:hypothetical protein
MNQAIDMPQKVFLVRDQFLTVVNINIGAMEEAVRIPETSVYFNETTWRHIPKSCYLQTSFTSKASS